MHAGGHFKQKSSMGLHVYEGQLNGTSKTFIPSKGMKNKAKGQEPLKKSKKYHMTFARLHFEWFTPQTEVAMYSKANNIKWIKMWISLKINGNEQKLKAIN